MKKRMMSILLLATMVTGLIAGCGSTKKEAKNDDDVVTVTWMTSRPVDGEIDQVCLLYTSGFSLCSVCTGI